MSELNTGDYLEHVSDLQPAIEGLRLGEYSDLVDHHGHQYVDIVLDGAGSANIAVLGHLHVLEQVGLRFLGIGGVSAGAITAAVLAATDRPEHARAEQVLPTLANTPWPSFVDGNHDDDGNAMAALKAWQDEARGTLSKLWNTSRVLDNLHSLHALNRGQVCHEWLDNTLRHLNGGQPLTVKHLRVRMNDLPALLVSQTADESDFRHASDGPVWEVVNGTRVLLRQTKSDRLCIVAADLATTTRVMLPHMAPLLWPHPDEVNVADFARAAMGTPGLYATIKLKSLPPDDVRPLWRNLGWPDRCYEGDFLPDTHHLVDAASLSPFPIDAFHHRACVPLRPTLGVRLRRHDHRHSPHTLLGALRQSLHTARHTNDSDWLQGHPGHARLVSQIDTEELDWFDFEPSDETRLRLFRMGARAAITFLRGFNWREHKRVRRALAQAWTQRA